MAFLKAEVDAVIAADRRRARSSWSAIPAAATPSATTSRTAAASDTVSHAILAGTPNHGIWAVKGMRESSEFSGLGPFLTGLNAPKNTRGDEVTPAVRWLTIRSDNNDKYAQPDGLWIGSRGTPTNVTYAGPELRGATNVVLPTASIIGRRLTRRPRSTRCTASSPARRRGRSRSCRATKLVLNGTIFGLGLQPDDPASGNFVNNLPLAGARARGVRGRSGHRRAARRRGPRRRASAADGRWGPFDARPGVPYEFVVSAAGYPANHIYRSPFPRSSYLIHLQMQRARWRSTRMPRRSSTMTRPRGYFDVRRDKMSFGGISPPPGLPPPAPASRCRS